MEGHDLADRISSTKSPEIFILPWMKHGPKLAI